MIRLDKNNSADELIWSIPINYQRNQKDFAIIIEHLLKTLSDYLQQPIENLDKSTKDSIVDEGEKFVCYIRSQKKFGGVFDMGWTGLLAMHPVEDGDKIYVGASIFLFSQDKRLALQGQGISFLEIAYEPDENGVGHWRTLGWEEDHYGTYEAYDSYLNPY